MANFCLFSERSALDKESILKYMRYTVPDDGALPDFSDVVRYYPNTAEDILCHTNNMCKISIFRWFPLCFELYGIPSMLECDWDAQKNLYKIASIASSLSTLYAVKKA